MTYAAYKKTMVDQITTNNEEIMVKLYNAMLVKIQQAKINFESGEKFLAQEDTLHAMKINLALMDN